eukprot:2130434-Amphidinium_carterae.1
MNAVALKIAWDIWTSGVGAMNLWSTLAAQRFHDHLRAAEKQHVEWEQLPHVENCSMSSKQLLGVFGVQKAFGVKREILQPSLLWLD